MGPHGRGSHDLDRPRQGAGTGSDGAATDPRPHDTAESRRRRSGDPTLAALYDELAPGYDRLTRLVSFGRDGRWRSAAVAATGLVAGDAVVDVAAGTGKLATALADRVGPFGHVVAIDLSPAMVERGAAATRDIVQLEYVVGDATALPFEDARFDAATIAFGLGGLGDIAAALVEIGRVVRPGGRIVCLERTAPTPWWWGRLYGSAVRRLAPLAGRAVGGGSAYGRIAEAVPAPPRATTLVEAMTAAGLVDVRLRRFWLGSVALVVGSRPTAG